MTHSRNSTALLSITMETSDLMMNYDIPHHIYILRGGFAFVGSYIHDYDS